MVSLGLIGSLAIKLVHSNMPMLINYLYLNNLGVTFAGTSSLFSLQRGSGKASLVHSQSRRDEGVEIWAI